jgi:predicted nucleic acid-binding protein
MSALFLDSSALAKRYISETGTGWIRGQIRIHTAVIVSRITGVEVMSAIARRQREGRIDPKTAQQIQWLVVHHFRHHYRVIEVDDRLASEAIQLLMAYPLRAYDAIQLASAKQVQHQPMTFVCADTRLLQFAQAEGLQTDDPNQHP